MAKKKLAKRNTEVFFASVIIEIQCAESVAEDISALIEPNGHFNVFRLDKLIGLPAFVEDDVPFDHPRSKEAWRVQIHNTLEEKLPIWRYSVTKHDQNCSVFIGVDMNVHIPLVRKLGEVKFGLVEEMGRYFGEGSSKMTACWSLTDTSGETIYGVAGEPGLIQEQNGAVVEMVKAVFDRFGKKALVSEESENA